MFAYVFCKEEIDNQFIRCVILPYYPLILVYIMLLNSVCFSAQASHHCLS